MLSPGVVEATLRDVPACGLRLGVGLYGLGDGVTLVRADEGAAASDGVGAARSLDLQALPQVNNWAAKAQGSHDAQSQAIAEPLLAASMAASGAAGRPRRCE